MIGIFKRLFIDKWRSLLIYIGSSLAFSEMYVALYPTLKDQLENLEGFLEAFPQEFMEAFGFTAETMSFATVESLMATEMFSFIWPIILIILVVGLANHSFAGDIEKGTIELTISQPISRIKIFLSRYLAGSLLIALFVASTVYGIILLVTLHGIEYNFESYTVMTVLGIAFALATYSVATLFSTIFSEKGKATFATVGLLITMYAVNIVANLRESLEWLKYTSFFNYFDTGKALVKVEYAEWSLPIFLVVFIIGSILALMRFKTRDIAV
jgi:ABC-2 type transport system permease protein